MFTSQEITIVQQAQAILAKAVERQPFTAKNAEVVKQFCQLHLGGLEHEVFAVLLLDSQLRLISFEQMFRGTIDEASVYPREVAKEALAKNAASVILVHNHPSGAAVASTADIRITKRLKSALTLLDIEVLDHIVVSATETYAFKEHGLL